ncbi:cupredoxin domain-containing protein [Thalassotalea atypica]|uniref:cupredoxin domain-containing protein n=1 Tax=Thalassotalea atypica TaxID=2054316 RepID=UPI002572A0CD|nr:plastocyanin/azurin family copper-binding protein [Thalassotalea atypica]
MRVLMILVLTLSFSGTLFAKEVVVEILKKKYIPAHVTIEVGDTVVWKNVEKRQYHNVWFKQFDKEEPDYFFPDETYQRTFDSAGEFPYECGPHPKMKGMVTVKGK